MLHIHYCLASGEKKLTGAKINSVILTKKILCPVHFATGRCCENVILVITRWPLLPATVTTGQCGELLYPPPPMASEFGKSLIKYPSPEIFKFLNNNNDYASILPTKGQIFPGPPLSCPGVLPAPVLSLFVSLLHRPASCGYHFHPILMNYSGRTDGPLSTVITSRLFVFHFIWIVSCVHHWRSLSPLISFKV